MSDGTTLLMEALLHENAPIARRLVEQGADVNAVRDNRKTTALMIAADADDLESLKLLLDHGADVTVKNKRDQTALDRADSEEAKALLQAAFPPEDGP